LIFQRKREKILLILKIKKDEKATYINHIRRISSVLFLFKGYY